MGRRKTTWRNDDLGNLGLICEYYFRAVLGLPNSHLLKPLHLLACFTLFHTSISYLDSAEYEGMRKRKTPEAFVSLVVAVEGIEYCGWHMHKRRFVMVLLPYCDVRSCCLTVMSCLRGILVDGWSKRMLSFNAAIIITMLVSASIFPKKKKKCWNARSPFLALDGCWSCYRVERKPWFSRI